MRVEKLSPHLGAKIHDVDLSAPVSDELFDTLHAAFLDHLVLVFPDQNLTPEALVRFAERFGTLEPPHPLIPSHPQEPRVTMIINDAERPPQNDIWHTDVTWKRTPPLGSALHAQVLPRQGGDTMWVSMYAVYDALSERDKLRLGRYRAVHSIEAFVGGNHDTEDGARVRQAMEQYPPLEHPVIRTHPETGRQAVFVNECFTTHITDIDRRESEAIISRIVELVARPEFQLRLEWEPNMLGLWDNRCTQHKASPDYYPEYREMRRVTIVGDQPYYRADPLSV